MPEYISRKDALKAVRDAGSPANEIFYAGVVAGYNALKGIPAADVAPVVRCKDCHKRKTNECPMYEDGEEFISDLDWTKDDGYCSLGVRMYAKEDAHAD